METELFEQIGRTLLWGFRAVVRIITTAARMRQAMAQRRDVYRRLAEQQAKADEYDVNGQPRREQWHDAGIAGEGERQ